MNILIVTATGRETAAVAGIRDTVVVESGIARTNAACATTEALLTDRYDAVISAGVAGSLPGGDLAVGDTVVASSCIYVEEGLATPSGFSGVEGIGFALGDFTGNAVPVDDGLLRILGDGLRIGPIATVATCSGTNERAEIVVRRTGAVAEAMEGAAVVHAARRRSVPAIEVRTISNRTGDRERQEWDLPAALEAMTVAMNSAIDMIRSSGSYR